MKTVFEKIATRELPGYIFWENEEFMAFLSNGPLADGHSLVVPKKNWGDYLFDLSNEQYEKLMAVSREVAKLMQEKLGCKRLFVFVQGLEVPHVHVHLIPGDGEVSLMAKPLVRTDEDFAKVFTKLNG